MMLFTRDIFGQLFAYCFMFFYIGCLHCHSRCLFGLEIVHSPFCCAQYCISLLPVAHRYHAVDVLQGLLPVELLSFLGAWCLEGKKMPVSFPTSRGPGRTRSWRHGRCYRALLQHASLVSKNGLSNYTLRALFVRDLSVMHIILKLV